nr:11837_t:CDS:10 [Entrophospora candida]
MTTDEIDDGRSSIRSSVGGDQGDNQGYNQKILTTFSGFAGNVNNMLGSGIYSTPGIVWQTVDSPGVALILWIFGGFVSLCGSLTYVEFGTITLESGGETGFFKKAFPKPKLLISYLFSFAWICAIRPASLGAVLQVLAQHFLFVVIPHPPENTGNTTVDEHGYCQASEKFHRQLHPNNDWGLEFWTLKIIGIIALSIITFYHVFSNVWASRINQALAVVKMLTLTVIISIGFVQLVRTDVSKPNWQNPFYVTENLSFSSVASALISVFFAYNGWNNLNYSLDEFKDPKGRLIYSNSLSVTVVTILYTLTNVAFITVVNSKDVNRYGKDFNEVIAGNFAKEIGGEKFGRALSFFVALSAFGAASSMTWSGSRVIVEASRIDFIPLFSVYLKQLDDKKYTPRNALLAQFIWCVMVFVILGGAFSSDPFKTLSDFSTYFAWIFYFLASIGLLWLRYKEAKIDRSFKVPNSLIAIFICSAIFIIIGNSIKKDIPKPSTSDYDDCQKNAITIDQYIIPIICGGFLFVGAGCWCISYFGSGGNSRNNNIRGDVSSENSDNHDNSDNKIVGTSL